MAFWNRWFGPKCDVCGGRLEQDRQVLDGRKLCAGCNEVASTRKVEIVDEPATPKASEAAPESRSG